MSHVIKNPKDVTPAIGTGYPPPHDEICNKREKHRLGDAVGLKNYGVNYVVLPPGQASAQRHWHEVQDEFVWVLEGELVLVTDAGEELLTPGMSAGFPGGEPDGHHLVNRTDKPAAYLEIGDRMPGDAGAYPDIDMRFQFDADGKPQFLHKDGTPY
jgi:uncharacterized cupin superfamily protein